MWSCPLQVGLHSDVRQASAVSTGAGIRRTRWYLRSSGSSECELFVVVSLASQVLVLHLWSGPLGLDHLLPQSSGQSLRRIRTHNWHMTAKGFVLDLFQNDDPVPPVLRRHSSSDISKQKFGTMPLVPIRGDESNSSMLSANQTLVSTTTTMQKPLWKYWNDFFFLLQRKLHDRRTLSMYFVSTRFCLYFTNMCLYFL